MIRAVITGLIAGMLALTAPVSNASDDDQFIVFNDSETIKTGREIWMSNCHNCHAFGTAGAPIPMNPKEWKTRVTKPRSVLYEHAINGFFGPNDTMMPARGGNEKLTDDEVKSAVDYMVRLAESYIKKP